MLNGQHAMSVNNGNKQRHIQIFRSESFESWTRDLCI